MLGEGFRVLLTTDQNLRYQQNLVKTGVSILVLAGAGNRIEDLIPLIPSTLAALASIRPGEVVEITG